MSTNRNKGGSTLTAAVAFVCAAAAVIFLATHSPQKGAPAAKPEATQNK